MSGRRRLFENLAALYGVQACNYVIPLLTIPYLGRTLGPAGWGSLAIAQSVGVYAGLCVEYGFDLSATRRIAQDPDNVERMAQVAAGVFGCKALFSLVVIGLACFVSVAFGFRGNPLLLLWCSVMWGLASGWSILWFFQGIQRVREAGLLDISARVLSTAGLFLFVHQPGDAWKILAIQAALAMLSTGCATYLVYRRVPFLWPQRSQVVAALHEGWSMFLFKSSASIMLSSNTFVLGLFAPVERVGYYSAAEKITRACCQLITPINQCLYPRLARLAHVGSDHGRGMARMFTAMTGMIGLGLGLALYAAAPFLVESLMGKTFLPAVPVLRVIAFLGPLVAVNSAFAFYWLFPAGLERPYTVMVICSMAFDVALNAVLAPRFGEIGTALAVVCTEITMLLGAAVLLRRTVRPAETQYAIQALDTEPAPQ